MRPGVRRAGLPRLSGGADAGPGAAQRRRLGIKGLMARMGHDSERAALIYQHEACGADKMITDTIDAHVEAEQRGREMTTVRLVRWCQRGNGPLMARKLDNYRVAINPQMQIMPLTCVEAGGTGDGERIP
jgi:hypothetical protein